MPATSARLPAHPARATGPGPAERPIRTVGRLVAVAMSAWLVVVAMAAAPAQADGPGYGGGADSLTVAWESGDGPGGGSGGSGGDGGGRGGGTGTAAGALALGGRSALAIRQAAPVTATTTGLTLVVDGVGFRGRSQVEVRVGSAEPFLARVDQTGTLDVGVPATTAEAATTGTSVVAIGRSPSGTSMTLVGAIPPRPSGIGPVDLVPWVAAAVALGMAGSWLVSRLRPAPARHRRPS